MSRHRSSPIRRITADATGRTFWARCEACQEIARCSYRGPSIVCGTCCATTRVNQPDPGPENDQ